MNSCHEDAQPSWNRSCRFHASRGIGILRFQLDSGHEDPPRDMRKCTRGIDVSINVAEGLELGLGVQ
eukprot:gene26006-biopygen12844